jgi:hypothetical protein
MPDDLELRQVKDAGKATAGHRRARAEQARFQALVAAIQADSANRLAELRSDRPAETGQQVDQRSDELERTTKISVGLAELAGLGDADMPWAAWQRDLTERLRMAETAYVQASDEADNADAYGVDEAQAQFSADIARCDVEALQAALEEVAGKVPAPNRANRRSSARQRTTAGHAADGAAE